MAKNKVTNGWTKEHIRYLLDVNDVAVKRGILQVYRRQTEDEKTTKGAHENNGVGFSKVDSQFMSSLAEQILDRGTLTKGQMAFARPKIKKYWKQLLMIAIATGTEPKFTPPSTIKQEQPELI